MNRPFSRTTCACHRCVQCCKDQPGPLAPGDFERIAARLGETPEQAAAHFCASPGALTVDWMGKVERVGTITPKRRKGRCVFLGEDDRCRIHAVSPAGCALFDVHMDAFEADPRSNWLVTQQKYDKQYQALRATLPLEDNKHTRQKGK